MTALAWDGNRLLCEEGGRVHKLLVLRTGDRVSAACLNCTGGEPFQLASLAWFESRDNLSLLLAWLGDMSPEGFRHVIEHPDRYEAEFRAAVAARDHERDTEHEVLKDGRSEERAYCDGSGWNYDDGRVVWLCPFCETRCEEPADVERKAHLGCLADVAHDEDVAREAAGL